MWQSTIDYLKSPQLVVGVQEFFGIRYMPQNSGADDEDANQPQQQQQRENQHHKRNISSSSSDEGFNEQTATSSSDSGGRRAVREDDGGGGDGERTMCSGSDASDAIKPYAITNRFWYYLFVLGTELGDEIFYATMIPFWFWNVDGAVGRRVVCVWSLVMYVGQSAKDVIRWPRPGRPVHRLQQKWGLEYGMPSTHAMVSVAMPFSVVAFMSDRYVFSLGTGIAVACVWSSVICLSRLYLGMHSVLVSILVCNYCAYRRSHFPECNYPEQR